MMNKKYLIENKIAIVLKDNSSKVNFWNWYIKNDGDEYDRSLKDLIYNTPNYFSVTLDYPMGIYKEDWKGDDMLFYYMESDSLPEYEYLSWDEIDVSYNIEDTGSRIKNMLSIYNGS